MLASLLHGSFIWRGCNGQKEQQPPNGVQKVANKHARVAQAQGLHGLPGAPVEQVGKGGG